MFVIDLLSAALLAVVLTVAFAAIVRARGYRGFGEVSAHLWLLALLSWIGGIVLVAFGPTATGTHWLPFAVAGLLIGLLVIALPKLPKLQGALHSETGKPGEDARPAIAAYFVVTLLLFFCAISLRFYIVNLA